MTGSAASACSSSAWSIFTGGSAIAALSSNVTPLIVARAIQGLGGAIITPLSLTILSAAVPRERRAVALGAWGGIAGLAIAIGPVIGGAIAEGLAWQWIFWINVPIGLIVDPAGRPRLTETHGPSTRLDLPGLGLVSGGLLAVVWGLVRANELGWTSDHDRRLVRRRRRPARGLRRLGGTERRADAPSPPLPLAHLHGGQRRRRC